MRHLPNLICFVRMALIWPIVLALNEGDHVLALVIFAAAAVSDGLDGYLAKRFNWTSELGRVLDPLADKLLLVVIFVAATWLGLVPWWLTAAAVARDVMIGLGAVTYRAWFGRLHGRPTILSKINTALQIAYLTGVILAAATGFPPAAMLVVLGYAALVTTVFSGIDYLFTFTRRAWESTSSLKPAA
jgi:cardiolipin synthase (CMP-forming)